MARKSRKPAAVAKAQETEGQKTADLKIYRTAVYARLSVEDSRTPGCDTIENQLSLIRSYIESRPYLKQTEEYIDNGVSGTRFDRPEFMRMVADMRAGSIDCIVVKDLSRLGRNYLEAGDYLEIMEQYAGFQELTSDIVHALISRITFFGEGRILIEYAFADEMRAFVELAESRKGEIACMSQEM